MGTLLAIAVLVVIVWAVARARGGASKAVPAQNALNSPFRVEIETAVRRDYDTTAPVGELRKVTGTSTKDHVPPPPSGCAVEAWSPRTQQVEVAGEWYRAQSLRTLFSRHAKVSDSGAEIRLDAVLVPDPSNPFDSRAVAVFVDGLHVGYMERPDAATYHDAITGLPGGELRVLSRQWLRGTANDTWARVTLSLPKPEHLACPNPTEADAWSSRQDRLFR